MPFRVVLSDLAAHRFRKLDPTLKRRIGSKLQAVAKDPLRHVRRLTGVPAYSIRIGDWRVVVDVDWDEEVIHVLTLGHRSTIYG